MSKFLTKEINYSIATGDKEFDPVQVPASNNIVTVEMDGNLDSSDASLELHQSIDGVAWGLIPDSAKVLSIGQTSHTWNVRGLVAGAFIRPAVKKGTATAGVVTKYKLLSDE